MTSQLQDASLHVCASASMMSSMETGAMSSHSRVDEQGLSYLIYYVVYDI